MDVIKIKFSSINPPYKVVEECKSIFQEYAKQTDAERHFSPDELKEMESNFVIDLMHGEKQSYIDFLSSEIESIKPSGLYGVYDFGLIREYEALIKRIEWL